MFRKTIDMHARLFVLSVLALAQQLCNTFLKYFVHPCSYISLRGFSNYVGKVAHPSEANVTGFEVFPLLLQKGGILSSDG